MSTMLRNTIDLMFISLKLLEWFCYKQTDNFTVKPSYKATISSAGLWNYKELGDI